MALNTTKSHKSISFLGKDGRIMHLESLFSEHLSLLGGYLKYLKIITYLLFFWIIPFSTHNQYELEVLGNSRNFFIYSGSISCLIL
jgi:hypothetical protein